MPSKVDADFRESHLKQRDGADENAKIEVILLQTRDGEWSQATQLHAPGAGLLRYRTPRHDGQLGWLSGTQVTTFSPMMPATIRPMQASRATVAGSPNSAMPSKAVPTAPIPVQIA